MKRKVIGLKLVREINGTYYVLTKGTWFSFTKENAAEEIKQIKESMIEEVISKPKLKEINKRIKYYYEKLYYIQEVDKTKEEG